MIERADNNVINRIVPHQEPEKPKVQIQPAVADNKTTAIGDLRLSGSNLKAVLNAKFDAPTQAPTPAAPKVTSPEDAFEQIKKIPVPNPNDAAAVSQYNQQRAAIADAGIKNSVPPSRDDFKVLNGRTAEYEYGEAKSYFDSQISKLKTISADAKANPTKLPREAELPDNTVDIDTDPAKAREIQMQAGKIIADAGGRENLDAKKVGEQIAAVAQTDPGRAYALARVILGNQVDTNGKGIVRDHDKDQIVESMVNKFSDDDLARIARTSNGKALLQRSQQHLLYGDVSDSEQKVADRIQRSLLDNGVTFSDAYNGVLNDAPNLIARYDPKAEPEEVARAIKSAYWPGDEFSNVDAFAKQLQNHQGDAQWIQRFYSALGREKAGKLISETVNTSSYRPLEGDNAVKLMQERAGAIRSSLETLHSSGRMSQQDLETLLKNTNDNPQVALEIIGKSTDSSLRSDFIKAVASSGSDNTKAAAIAMISQLPENERGNALTTLDQSQLNNLFTGAMRAKGEIEDFSDEVYGRYFNEGKKVTVGDVTSLIQSAAGDKYSSDLKQKLFLAASTALNDDKVNKNFADNNVLRESLSQIFIDETKKPGADNLLVRLASQDNGRLNNDNKTALSGFFAFTVYAPNQTANSPELASTVRKLFLDAGSALSDKSLVADSPADLQKAQADFKAKYGLDPKLYATMVGGLFKSAQDGLKTVQRRYSDDEEARKAAISFFVDTAASLVPGVSGIAAKGIKNGILNTLVDKTTGAVDDKVRGQLKDSAVNYLVKLSEKANKGSLSDDDLKNIIDDFVGVIPNQRDRSDGKVSVDILDGFNAGYNGY